MRRLELLVAWGFIAFLAWRGSVAVIELSREIRETGPTPVLEALNASHEDRVRTTLGSSYESFVAVRRSMGQADALFVVGSDRTASVHILAASLRHLLFPVRVMPVLTHPGERVRNLGRARTARVLDLAPEYGAPWESHFQRLEEGDGFVFWGRDE